MIDVEYWDDGFNVQTWQDDFLNHITLLKIVPCSFYLDPVVFIRDVIGYEFVNEIPTRQRIIWY